MLGVKGLPSSTHTLEVTLRKGWASLSICNVKIGHKI